MELDLTEDQAAVSSTVAAILGKADAALDGATSSFAATLDAELAQNGVFDAALHEELGLPFGVMIVQQIGASASVVEAAASAVLRPLLCPEAPRPLAVLHADIQRVARFLPVARSVVFIGGGRASWCAIDPDDVEPVEGYFAYPMGRLRHPAACFARAKPCAEPALAHRLALVASAAEISGVLQGGLDSVIAYLRDRRQFGKALGSFQALQHRLAQCSTRITAAKWLTVKAAAGTDSDAMLAAGYAQETVDPVAYDLHQFMGAMGLTLEHPLHRWTYRAKLLKSDFGGASRHFRALADAVWA